MAKNKRHRSKHRSDTSENKRRRPRDEENAESGTDLDRAKAEAERTQSEAEHAEAEAEHAVATAERARAHWLEAKVEQEEHEIDEAKERAERADKEAQRAEKREAEHEKPEAEGGPIKKEPSPSSGGGREPDRADQEGDGKTDSPDEQPSERGKGTTQVEQHRSDQASARSKSLNKGEKDTGAEADKAAANEPKDKAQTGATKHDHRREVEPGEPEGQQSGNDAGNPPEQAQPSGGQAAGQGEQRGFFHRLLSRFRHSWGDQGGGDRGAQNRRVGSQGESKADAFAKMKPDEALSKLDSSRDGLSSNEARRRLAEHGPNKLAEEHVSTWERLLSYFWGPIPWMIEIAAVLSIVDRDWKSFGVIIAMLVINAGIGFWQEKSAADALDALKGQLALKAQVRRDGQWTEIDSANLVPGDWVSVELGDVTPADIKLLDGDYLSVDQSALTGESLPVSKNQGQIAFSGTLVKEGEMAGVVCATGAETRFGQTAMLVESAGAKSHFQRAVLHIGNLLIASAGVFSAILIGVEIARGLPLLKLITFVLIVVVASIPVAMPAVLSVTMALGALALSRKRAIVSRLEAIEEVAGVSVLCSDKTGTLTQNKLTLGDPVLFEAKDNDEIILAGALASKKAERDAIDTAVVKGLSDEKAMDRYEQTDFTPFNPRDKRSVATLKGDDGSTFSVTKGAPQVIIEMCKLSGDALEHAQQSVDKAAEKGFRTLGVARSQDEGKTWDFLGILPLYDPPRQDSAETIKEARAYGIGVKMVTGDNTAIAREIAGQLGMGTNIQEVSSLLEGKPGEQESNFNMAQAIEEADGFAEVFPEHKYRIVKALQDAGHIVAMTGDGVNDAPALKQAEVGIAVSGATEAARSAASLILTAPGLSVIIKAVEEARRIFERMMSYTTYRIAMTLNIMVFVVLTMLIFNDFPLTTIMIILLALLDDIPIMTIAWDNTELDAKPVRWRMDRLLAVSGVLGGLSLAEAFGLYLVTRQVLGIPLDEVQTMLFLQLIAGGHLLLLVTRTRRLFWRPPYPAWQLLTAIVLTQAVGVFLAGFGYLMPAISWTAIGLIWAYDIVWMFVLDLAKLGTHRLIDQGARHHRVFLGGLQSPLHPARGHVRRR